MDNVRIRLNDDDFDIFLILLQNLNMRNLQALRRNLESIADDAQKARILNGYADNFFPLIHLATLIGNLEACILLSDNGASITTRDSQRNSPMDYLNMPEIQIPNREELLQWFTHQAQLAAAIDLGNQEEPNAAASQEVTRLSSSIINFARRDDEERARELKNKEHRIPDLS